MPEVSIITALHNKGAYIAATIASVQAQTLCDWELIIVENGSMDDGPTVVSSFAKLDRRIRLIESKRLGPGTARNRGLRAATGDWILFLDADDLIEPRYLDARLGDSVGADIVAGPWQEFADENLDNLTRRMPDGWNDRMVPLESAFCFTPWILHAAIIRRDYVSTFGGWNEDLDCWPSEDCTFWFAALQDARIAWSQYDGALYRRAISGSRDDHTCDRERAFEGSRANLLANEQILARIGKRPSATQAATAFRVLRAQLPHAAGNTCLENRIHKEALAWLGLTSWMDPRMLIWRLIFR